MSGSGNEESGGMQIEKATLEIGQQDFNAIQSRSTVRGERSWTSSVKNIFQTI